MWFLRGNKNNPPLYSTTHKYRRFQVGRCKPRLDTEQLVIQVADLEELLQMNLFQ